MSELKKIPVILDGDPGHDDAIGWTLAQGSGRFDILAVTSCSGNVGIEKTTYNALRVCTLLGIDAPIATTTASSPAADSDYTSATAEAERRADFARVRGSIATQPFLAKLRRSIADFAATARAHAATLLR